MSEKDRLPRIMVTSEGRIPSVELGAIVPLSELQKQGLCEFRYRDQLLLSPADIAWCDILFIVRGTSSLHVWAAQWAKKHERIVLGYWDDDFLSIPAYIRSYSYYSSQQIRTNIGTLFRLTDAFFSPNARLAAKLSVLHGRDVKLLPGVLGTEALKAPTRGTHSLLTVGCASSLDLITILGSLIGPAIVGVARAKTNFRIHIIGPNPRFIRELLVEARHTPYMPNYYDYLAFASQLGWDIGLAPQIDSEFTAHKFYNKLLEYTHIGCAGIYSKLEPYTLVIEDGVTGLLAENQVPAWEDAVLRLLKDPELRFKIASNAYEFVRNHHNRQVVADQYAAALAPFLGHRAPQVSTAHLLWSDPVRRLTRVRSLSIEFIRGYGIRRFLQRAPGYAFSLLRRKATRFIPK
jgi:hypothetical protein